MNGKIKPRLPVVICDPGCRDKRGHHYEFNNFLQEEIEISECLTNIHSKVAEYNKVFYHSPYSIVPAEHKQTYREQIAADAALIAELSSNKICIVQHASSLLIQALHTTSQCYWENIVIPFPQSPASGVAEIEPKLQICYDRWYKPAFGTKRIYFYFPRSKAWFFKNNHRDFVEKSILFAGSKREEKAFSAFLEFAETARLSPTVTGHYEQQADYIEKLLNCEYLWCGYEDIFQTKPSNTLLDGVCIQKPMIISNSVMMKSNGFLPGRKTPFGQLGLLRYEPLGKQLLIKNNSLFLSWLSASLALHPEKQRITV